MPFTLSENWDGVTAPAVPAGWNVDAPYTTSTSHPYTSPNSLVLGDSSSVKKYATYGTADPDHGATVAISSRLYMASGSPVGLTANAGVTFRCSSATMDNSSTSCYWAYLLFDTGMLYATLYLAKIVNGTATTIASQQNDDQTVGANAWYEIAVLASGSTFNVSLRRPTDGYYMDATGYFTSTSPTYAIPAASDSSIASGDYSGLCALSNRSGRVFFDDGTISTTSGAVILPPRAPLVVPIPFQYYHPD